MSVPAIEQDDRPEDPPGGGGGGDRDSGSFTRNASPAPVGAPPGPGAVDPRMRAAWRTWLSALGKDAEAAMAAALAYESLPDEGRDAWLDALEVDAKDLDVPPVALYAPLLAVEEGDGRRARMAATLEANGVRLEPPAAPRALLGKAPTGEHVCVVLSPLYLDFVEILVCRYTPEGGVLSARRDPVRHLVDALGGTRQEGGATIYVIDGVAVTDVPLRCVIEELAHAVVADTREGRDAPVALSSYAHLFGPDLDAPEMPVSRP